MSKTACKVKLFVAALGLLTFNAATAQALNEAIPSPWTARFTGQGLSGNNQLGGFVDSMIPLVADANHLWFADGSFMAGQSDNYAFSLGSGLRKLATINTHPLILGAFLFGDYQRTTKHTHTWLANPGIELLSRHYEARIQGYLPVGRRQQAFSHSMASVFPPANGPQQTNRLFGGKGHLFIDTPINLVNEFGTGLEAEGGRYFSLFKGAWLRAGFYHFDYKSTKSINGGEVNIEFYVNNNASLILQNNYDNQNKNKFSIGIRYSFGGPNHTDVSNLSNRMEEPIIRHLARQSYGMATPVRDSFVVSGPTQILASNVWYFSRQGTAQGPVNLNSCTAEHPCLDLDQTVADGINALTPSASLWFATGQYQLPTTGTNGLVSLHDGQSLYGRTIDFSQTAIGPFRPEIIGALWWKGSGAISDFQVSNNNQIVPSAINGTSVNRILAVGASGNLTINNSEINTSNSTANIAAHGVFGLENIAMSNSVVNATDTGNTRPLETSGIRSLTDSIVSNSIINVNSHNFSYGVITSKDAIVNGSIINLNSNSSSANFSAGIQTEDAIFASNSVINIAGKNNDVYALSAGTFIISNTNTLTASSTGSGVAQGLNGTNSTAINSTILVKSTGSGRIAGIEDYSGGNTLSLNNSIIRVENTGSGQAVGLSAATGNIIFQGLGATKVFVVGTPALATLGASLTNSSTPASQCSVNGGVATNC
ncbi:hypothetical protein BN59_01980 [Legionella massiliensis]|uniref:Inverse autotransporter beta-domain domain-containing protein n=1 Tax=Legionella massiliensis TaxID=1034943 RepID=A0A078KT90_9GAMM|nr:hypothetical protein [Legionella massiliensis]CDZ77690.1 hypothetical protein BN59_01980 [Legionella massiliensis]CEE13428.1 hypothetical protein BN1094_01980 [Legionella massiliensis]